MAAQKTYAVTLTSQNVRGKKQKTKNMVFTLPVFLCVAMIVVATFFYIWSRLEIVNLGYEISSEQKKRVKLLEENRNLRLQVMSLKSPERIERIAKRKLGLIYPTEEQVVVIK